MRRQALLRHSIILSSVENAVAATPSPFDNLFEQEKSGVFGRNYVTGLLWALEGIAWEESYLSRTAVVLAEIAAQDPGGNWANRPSNTLTDIFLPWMPHTVASVEKRQAALNTICAEQPDVAWSLLESLLPKKHTSTSGTHKPKWRAVLPEGWEKGVTRGEYWEQTIFCANLIVSEAGYDIAKLTTLASQIDHLPSPASELLRDKLLSDECLKLPEHKRFPLWDALRRVAARHRHFPNAEWSLGDESLLPIEEIINHLAPLKPSLANIHLFSDSSFYLYEGDGDWREKEEQIFQKRKAAMEEVLKEGGLTLALEFATTASIAHHVGAVLADMDQSEFDAELLPTLLDMEDQKLWSLIAAYAWRRKSMKNWDWFDDINKADWEPKQIALLLCALPFERNAWDRAAQLLGNNESEYWKNTSAQSYQTEDDTEYALRKLIEFGRPNAAIECIGRDISAKKEINTDLACDALLAIVQTEEPNESVDTYHVTEIIKALQENETTDQDKLFHVEWAYVTLLDEHSAGSPITLENRLASDPSFFCELIKLTYRADGVESIEPTEQSQKIATNAYHLLSSWKVIPGTQSDGKFEPDAFTNWLNTMEEVVKESGHYDVSMHHVGNVLVNSPQGSDGLWMHPVIAQALNHRDRANLREGYSSGVHISRGIHTIDPEGKPERELAEKYRQRADQIENVGYQRLATTLRGVADSYDR